MCAEFGVFGGVFLPARMGGVFATLFFVDLEFGRGLAGFVVWFGVALLVFGLSLNCSWSVWVGLLAFPCFVRGLLALPLCGAALTFFAAAKKDKQRKRLKPLILKRVPRTVAVVVHLESVASHTSP